jgi:transposase
VAARSESSSGTRVLELEALLTNERAKLAAERAKLAALTAEHNLLKLAFEDLRMKVALAHHRLVVAKAERIDTTQLEIELGQRVAELDALNREHGIDINPKATGPGGAPTGSVPPRGANANGEPPPKGKPGKPSGRRQLREVDIPEQRIELTDPDLEGKVPRIGFEESCKLMWRRAGHTRLVVARAKYRDAGSGEAGVAEEPMLLTTPLPPQILPRSIGTPSLFAHTINEKLCFGMPFHRQADRMTYLGVPLDRSVMCRWAEELGATVGATVVHAMRNEAMRTAFCIATDATGILVQPIPGGDRVRRACTRGHFLVQIADQDHVFFEFLAKETSATIGELFRGFSGYIQADAKSVYNLLYKPPSERPPPTEDEPPDLAERFEVGCWAHLRRKWWESAITTKNVVAREGLLRIKRVFDLDRTWKGKSAREIKELRELHLRPHTDAFFAWARDQYELVKGVRGMLRSALGYAVRQEGALVRFFDDGRLRLTNNDSERELRRIATGRNAWLFVGSEDHGQATGNLLTLIASARLHGLDSEGYLRDLFRILPHWPSGRFLELAPKYWRATRARLDPAQLEDELGLLTIPLELPPTTEQAASS